ncbi:MAG TPA: hypothetical protein VFI15_05055 [Candidatus Limnocylindrales bacterium]|nr:hypothetical protein [Candidatus Limnocylindrales bacterium]
MIRKRLGRIATIFTASAMALLLLGVGSAAAKNPTWGVSFQKLPTAVGAGHDAGWAVTVVNNGPSQINDLNISVTSEIAGQLPSYLSDLVVSTGFGETCGVTNGVEVCNVGSLPDGATVTFTVAFHVPTGTTGSFDLNVNLRAGTGDTGSDGGTSRGDTKTFTSSTGISSSNNFDGGFTVGSTTFETTGNLGRNNKQTTSLDTTDLNIPVTVTDGISSFACNLCSNLVGEWSVLDVNNGSSGPIKVTIMVWGGSVPGGVSPSDLYLIHADGTGGYTIVDQLCDSTHSNADCLAGTPVKIGNNYKIVAWLQHNGGIRGGF